MNIQSMSMEYEIYEKQSGSRHNRRTISGKTVGCSKCVGYCRYEGHPGFLTAEQRKQHDCCGKGCFYYVEKPARVKAPSVKPGISVSWILEQAASVTDAYEGMRILGVDRHDSTGCCLRYATISNAYPIGAIEGMLSQMIQSPVTLRKINCDYDRAIRLIYGL